MTLSKLKASDLQSLWACQDAEAIATHNTLAHFSVDILHRGLAYAVGRTDPTDWRGPYWCLEESTGIIYRGTLSDLKEWIICCSAAHYEPHGFRHIK